MTGPMGYFYTWSLISIFKIKYRLQLSGYVKYLLLNVMYVWVVHDSPVNGRDFLESSLLLQTTFTSHFHRLTKLHLKNGKDFCVVGLS